MAQAPDATGRLITIASLLWDANEKSQYFSRCYNESWVIKLYNGFARNLNLPWRFVLFTDHHRELIPDEIKQEIIRSELTYSACVEPFRYGVPMILCGLDTVVTGNVDHLAAYCLEKKMLALPRDPYAPERAANGVCLIPEGHHYVYRNWHGENDMEWLRKQPHEFIDDLFPKQVVSYKGYVKHHGLGDARIVYFHGQEKPHELTHLDWIQEHWRLT